MDNYSYPAGSDDRWAPWNAEDLPEDCEQCGKRTHESDLVEVHGGLCMATIYICPACAAEETEDFPA